MSAQRPQNFFEQIYNDTYDDLLRYVVFKCNNLDDVNDIIQETYIALYKSMNKQQINEPKAFIIGIAKNKLKKHYDIKNKIKNLFITTSIDEEEMVNKLSNNFDLQNHILEKITKEEIWQYLKNKNITTAKIFYLYYAESVSIKEIAVNLKMTESSVKNHLYRTLKELNELFTKEEI